MIFTFSLIFLCILVSSYARVPSELPNPLENPAFCGRKHVLRSKICDPDDMLSNDSKDTLEGYIDAIKAAELAVVVVSKISSSFIDNDNIDEASEQFALNLHNRWGVGDKKKQNGILIFVSIGDRSIYISVGDGLASLLSEKVPKKQSIKLFSIIK